MLFTRPGAALRLLLGTFAALFLLGTTAAHAQTITAAYANPSASPVRFGNLTIPAGRIAIVRPGFGSSAPPGVNSSNSSNGVFLNGGKLTVPSPTLPTSSAFRDGTSYTCTANATTSPTAIQVTNFDGAQFILTSAAAGPFTARYICVGIAATP